MEVGRASSLATSLKLALAARNTSTSSNGLGDDLIEVITIDALKHAHLEPDPRGFDACQDHWA